MSKTDYHDGIPCIGGPLNGHLWLPHTYRLAAIIPPEDLSVWARQDHPWNIIKTEYALKEVGWKYGSLEVLGRCYFWEHNRSHEPQQLFMLMIAHMAAGAPSATSTGMTT